MIRAFFYTALLTILASGAWGEEIWTKLEPYKLDRFEVSLPSGPDWNVQSGDHWFNLSSRSQTADGDLYVWVGFEINSYPENRFDWLAAEIAKEIRDVQAMSLLNEEAEGGGKLAFLEYGEKTYAERLGYSLAWARQVYIESLGRAVPEYQELHVFIPDDHAADFLSMSIYFGVLCLADCASEYPTTELLHPILSTVKIKAHE